MGRLIDADAIENDWFEELHTNYEDDYGKGFQAGLFAAIRQPTVDAVPVVRCKDCEHFIPDKAHYPHDGVCFIWNHEECLEDDFCSYGERKEHERTERLRI